MGARAVLDDLVGRLGELFDEVRDERVGLRAGMRLLNDVAGTLVPAHPKREALYGRQIGAPKVPAMESAAPPSVGVKTTERFPAAFPSESTLLKVNVPSVAPKAWLPPSGNAWLTESVNPPSITA